MVLISKYPFRVLIWIASACWLFLAALQSVGVIQIGDNKVGLAWVGYLSAVFLAILVCDVLTKLRSKLTLAYALSLLHFIVFNLVIAFDWYRLSPLVNRAEHFWGGFIVAVAVWAVLQEVNDFRMIKSAMFKLVIFLAICAGLGVVNELVELAADYFLHTSTIGPDLWDTNWDLWMNALGSIAWLGIIYLMRSLKWTE